MAEYRGHRTQPMLFFTETKNSKLRRPGQAEYPEISGLKPRGATKEHHCNLRSGRVLILACMQTDALPSFAKPSTCTAMQCKSTYQQHRVTTRTGSVPGVSLTRKATPAAGERGGEADKGSASQRQGFSTRRPLLDIFRTVHRAGVLPCGRVLRALCAASAERSPRSGESSWWLKRRGGEGGGWS